MNCDSCKKATRAGDLLCCSTCRAAFHQQCTEMSADNFKKLSKDARATWKCASCKARKQTQHKHLDTISTSNDDMGDASLLLVREDVMGAKILESIRDEVKNAITAQFHTIKDKIDLIPSLKKTIEFISAQYDDLKQSLLHSEIELNEIKTENGSLKQTVASLSSKVEQLEQRAREGNVEIQGVPEHKGENLVNTVMQLGRAVKCDIADRDILSVSRVAKMNPESSRPRAVVARLRSARCRDLLLSAAAGFNRTQRAREDKLHSEHLGIAGARVPVFVGEHLTPANKQLHAAARAAARTKQYKFVWVRGGRVFLRKNETSPALCVKDIKWLDTL